MKEWWHRRTDSVGGIDKLIGEPGSMFREHLVKPGLALIAFGIGAVALWKGCRQ